MLTFTTVAQLADHMVTGLVPGELAFVDDGVTFTYFALRRDVAIEADGSEFVRANSKIDERWLWHRLSMPGLTSDIVPVRSPDSGVANFGFDCWVPTGSPIANDPLPNSTPPAANRKVRLNAYAKGAVQFMGSGLLRLVAIGTGTVVHQTWFFDATLNTWVPWGPNTTTTIATTNITVAGGIAPGAMVNMDWFVQIVSTTGTPTNFGYGFV
jgi:hypothetical protein